VIAYESGEALWVMDEDGSNPTEILALGNYVFVPSWSSVGDGVDTPFRVLITGAISNLHAIRVVDVVLDGGVPTLNGTKTLTSSTSYVQGRVSPDGLQFVAAFVGDPPEFDNGGVVVSGMSGFSPEMIISNPSGHELYWPVWLSDTEIAFFDGDTSNGLTTVKTFVLGSATLTEVYQVPSELGTPRHLRWSPDGNGFLFDAGGDLYRVILGGTGSVLENLGPGIAPTWSPDASQVVYSERGRLYKKTLDSNERDARLTKGGVPDWRR
jgi:hypothetical protein